MKAYKVIIPLSVIDVVLGETKTEAVENWFQLNKELIKEGMVEEDE